MTVREQVLAEIATLKEDDLSSVAQYISFLKYRILTAAPSYSEEELARLYAEFADEDSEMAEAGLSDYAEGLQREEEDVISQ